MTFLAPIGFYILAASSILVLLSLLRSRIRRKPISALFLWKGLMEEPEPRSVRFQRWLDPLLFLQLAVLAALVFAIVQPMWRTEQTVFQGVALVIDASASMNTQTEAGQTRYQKAIDRALEVLDESTSSKMTLIHYTSQPRVLVPPTSEEATVVRELASSTATWLSDGAMDSLVDLLSAVGGLEAYDRILLLSDHVPSDVPAGVDVEVITGGSNVAISAFTVRENLTGSGATVFLELRNETEAFLDVEVKIKDEHHSITLSLPLGPDTTDQYIVPFLASRGTTFIASVDVDDDLVADNTRYFALARPSSIRVRWTGPDNLFLRAGLESVLPVVLVGAQDDYDLAVLVNSTLDTMPSSNVILLNSQVNGQVLLGEQQSGGFAETNSTDHPFLLGIEAEDIYVESLPVTDVSIPHTPLLTVNGLPFVTDAGTEQRIVLILSTDLSATNLPITVDFPMLLRNVLSGLQRQPSSLVHDWRMIGQLIEEQEFGTFVSARNPSDEPIALVPGQLAILTDEPGFYEITTPDGVIPIAINIDPIESRMLFNTDFQNADVTVRTETKEILVRLWPYFALLLLILLVVESLVYVRTELVGGRMR